MSLALPTTFPMPSSSWTGPDHPFELCFPCGPKSTETKRKFTCRDSSCGAKVMICKVCERGYQCHKCKGEGDTLTDTDLESSSRLTISSGFGDRLWKHASSCRNAPNQFRPSVRPAAHQLAVWRGKQHIFGDTPEEFFRSGQIRSDQLRASGSRTIDDLPASAAGHDGKRGLDLIHHGCGNVGPCASTERGSF